MHALVVGLGREGIAVARWLVLHRVQVTVTDSKAEDSLAANLRQLDGLPIEFVLGGHPLWLLDRADIVFVSPGIPEIPLLTEARRRGIPLSSETRLFARLCRAKIVGITGSSGKTTTTTLVGRMLAAAGYRTWVGGNIGQPLLPHLDQIMPTDRVVMELSSFQLELFGQWPVQQTVLPAVSGQAAGAEVLFDPYGWSPPVAAVLNITPNHLDRHQTMDAYIAAKAQIVAHQGPADMAVLGLDNGYTRRMGRELRGGQRVLWFSMVEEAEEGAFLRGDRLVVRVEGQEAVVCQRGELRLLGQHNVANMLAAFALAGATGVPTDSMRQVAVEFRGVEHRLELVRDLGGVRWYNDSIATSPERTVAALAAFECPIILLAGGRDKHLPWEEMAATTWAKARAVILFGEAAELIERAMRHAEPPNGGQCQIVRAGTLERAVEVAARLAKEGDVVLLAPGGTSFDAYTDFAARGEHFRQLVKGLE